MSRLLLDSHTWLWLGLGIELKSESVRLCDEAADRSELYLSPFSVWELSRKALLGDLDLPSPARVWMTETRVLTRVRMASFDFNVAYDVHELPEEFHKDPVDRVLASTCRMQSMTLLTRDRALLSLASKRIFSALKV